MKDMTKANFEHAEAQLKKLAELKAQPKAEEYTPAEIQEITADLGSFQMTTDNSGLLSVSHPSLNDATIGTVSEKEYARGNKEAILKAMLSDRFSAFVSTHTLKFTGSFSEPKISKAEPEVIPQVEKKAAQETPFEPSKETTMADLPRASLHDSFRETIEREALRNQETVNRFVTSAMNDLVLHLRALRYGSPKILSVDSQKLAQGDAGLNGFITVETTLESQEGPKALNIPVTVTSSKYVFPNQKEMSDLVSKSVDLRSELYSKLVDEAVEKFASIDADVAFHEAQADAILNEGIQIEKTASDYTDGVAYVGPGATIKLQKHLLDLPEDCELGTVIFADGKHWKLVDKTGEQNDKNEGSASLWSFVECLPEEADKKPETHVQR